MLRNSVLVGVLVSCLAAHATAMFLEGRVVNSLGLPIAGADVSVGAGAAVTTDSEGWFVLSGTTAVGERRGAGLHAARHIGFSSSIISVGQARGLEVEANLFSASGRRRELFRTGSSTGDRIVIDLTRGEPLASGMYICRLTVNGTLYSAPLVVAGGKYLWKHTSGLEAIPTALAKRTAAVTISASAGGFAASDYSLTEDTALGLSLTLYGDGMSEPAPVQVQEATETGNFTVAYAWSKDWFSWVNANVTGAGYNKSPQTRQETRTFPVVHLDNGLIKVTVAPSLGMRVLRVEDKTTGTTRQMFDRISSPYKAYSTEDVGGVEPSFPFYEHGVSVVNDSAGFFVKTHPDGSADVVMNMRFDHHQIAPDIGYMGKNGDRPLCGVVSLRPGSSKFTVRYIGENPNPNRRSNRVWNDAFMPTETPHEILFPTRYAVGHGASKIWDGYSSTEASQFALYAQYPFCGVYYPTSGASHLRINDPVKTPGMKLYDGAVIEFWGSTNVVFEAPDGFVGAFEPVELSNDFYMTRSIGKVTYANGQVAIAVAGNAYKLITTAPAVIDVYSHNETSNALHQQVSCGPTTVIEGQFVGGLRVVANGKQLCNVAFPLQFTDNRSRYDEVRAKALQSGGLCEAGGSRVGFTQLDTRWGHNYELEGTQNKWCMLTSLASVRATSYVSAASNADSLLSIATAAYRHGAFDVVNTLLGYVGNQRAERSKYLRALMDLELGNTTDFSGTPIEGAYFRALERVKAGNKSGAISEIDALLAQRPSALRPRLLKAYIQKDLAEVVLANRLTPGSIETWVVLKEMRYPGASETLAGLLKQNLSAAVAADDFLKELTQGTWRHTRRFEYDASWFTANAPPPFPANLKY